MAVIGRKGGEKSAKEKERSKHKPTKLEVIKGSVSHL
jgi:hypothetical protein